jgi:hypothetical protein
MTKGFPSDGNETKYLQVRQSKVFFVDPEDASKYANFRVPAMDRREQNGVGIFVF